MTTTLDTSVKPAVTTQNLSKTYGKGEATVHALNNVTVSFEQGKFTAIMGPSGSGKSTIANLVTRFYDVTQGEILLDGVNIQDYRLSDLRENCAVVSQ